MSSIRPAAVAGTFYPADREELAGTVGRLLASASSPPLTVRPQMVVVPHAGYQYSGPVAATAYAAISLAGVRAAILLGPSHFTRFAGLALPDAHGFATPLGTVPVDTRLREWAVAHARSEPEPHRREHSLEVQLPFLQIAAPGMACLPVLTGDAEPTRATELLDEALDGTGVVAFISTDLSHYLDHAAAQRADAATARAIVELRPSAIGRDAACGRTALQAALGVAASRGWRCQQLDLRNSGDTAGGRSRVVGYGAFALGPAGD